MIRSGAASRYGPVYSESRRPCLADRHAVALLVAQAGEFGGQFALQRRGLRAGLHDALRFAALLLM